MEKKITSLKQKIKIMKTVYPTNPPKDFNDWIRYIYSLTK